MKTKLMIAGVLVTMSLPAFAMDDAERARQMELYGANQNGGAMVTTETTIDPATNTTTTTTTSEATASPAAPVAHSTTGLTQRSVPVSMAPAVEAAPAAAEPVVANENKMTPIVEGGAVSSTVSVTSDGLTEEERAAQLKAYEEYAKAHPAPVTAVDPNAPYVPQAQAAGVIAVDGPVTGTAPVALTTTGMTTTEKTTETKYTVTSRKVGLVGNRPYPAQKSELDGGVTMERTVNGVLDTKQVVVPDNVAAIKDQKAEGDYFSAMPEAEVYENTNSDVKVHDMGMNRLND